VRRGKRNPLSSIMDITSTDDDSFDYDNNRDNDNINNNNQNNNDNDNNNDSKNNNNNNNNDNNSDNIRKMIIDSDERKLYIQELLDSNKGGGPKSPYPYYNNHENAILKAIKLVPKSLFWDRVLTGQERADTLVREVLAQFIVCQPIRHMVNNGAPIVQIFGTYIFIYIRTCTYIFI
jgi:hypothetical protein